MKKVHVVGAGMSGLLSAYYLLEKGWEIEVFEARAEEGGKIKTQNTLYGLREMAANAILADKEVEGVARTVGVHLTGKSKTAKNRWIWRSGPRRWPIGLMGNLSFGQFLIHVLFKSPARRPYPQELLKDWGYRVLGREVTEYLLNPACLGIFGVDSNSLSGTLVYDYFFSREKREKGELRGSVAPCEGMSEFPKKLRAYLENKGVRFHTNQKLAAKSEYPVVLATDWRSATEFLQAVNDGRAAILASVPGVDLWSVNIFFKNKPEKQKPGFGILFPRQEGIEPLGVLMNSEIFPEQTRQISETWIFGGLNVSPQMSWSDGDFLNSILKTREQIWDSKDQPTEFYVNRWPQALPLYGLELEKALQKLPLAQNGIYLAGNYLGELGLNRLFHRARQLAELVSPSA